MLVSEMLWEVVLLTCFKVMPAPHRDLAAVKFALVLQSCLLRLLPCSLTSVAPAEVIKLPERVCGEHKVPNGQ